MALFPACFIAAIVGTLAIYVWFGRIGRLPPRALANAGLTRSPRLRPHAHTSTDPENPGEAARGPSGSVPAEHETNGEERGDRHVRGQPDARERVPSEREVAGQQ